MRCSKQSVVFLAWLLACRVGIASKVVDVASLSQKDFEETIDAQERVLVDFFAPWCGHCQDLEPEFKQAANDARAESFETMFAKVDAIANPELAKKYKVTSYPTIHYFEDGNFTKTYSGDRKANAIMKWLRRQENPAVNEIQEEQVEQFLQATPTDSFAIVARVKENSARHKTLMGAVDNALRDYEVSSIRLAVVLLPKTAHPKNDASLLMWRPNFTSPDPDVLWFDDAWNEASIIYWAKNGTYPSIGSKFSPQKYKPAVVEDIGGTGSVVVLLDDSAGISEADALKPKMMDVILPLARRYTHWRFTFADFGELIGREPEMLGAQRTFEPLVSVLQGNKRWVLEGADKIQKTETVQKFFSDVLSKKAKARYKSAPKPDSDVDSDGVSVLTGVTFEEIAFNASRDVFVFYHSPTCQHSKDMAPEWAALANKVSEKAWKDRGVVVAKMDVTENGCDEEITGTPKLVLYPAVPKTKKFKSREIYKGARKIGSLVDFLLENARTLEAIREAEESGEKTEGGFSMVERELRKKRRSKEL